MSNELFTSDATGVTHPATADEVIEAARAILSRRVRRYAAAVILAHNTPQA